MRRVEYGPITVGMTTAVSRSVAQISCARCIQEMHVIKRNLFPNSISAFRAFTTGITYLTGIWNVSVALSAGDGCSQ
jgi:hypothetical protein